MSTALVRFLVPGTSHRFRCGGLSVEQQTSRLLAGVCSTELVTYRERSPDYPYLDDLLRREPSQERVLWIVSWGFDVPWLIRRLQGHRVAYHAHSSGYGFTLPPGVAVLAVSANTLGYWGDRAPRNPLFLLPNSLERKWLERGARCHEASRSIDVLVQARKSSDYLLYQLVPALRSRGLRVTVQTGWVEDLVDLFNQATVVLYDSADYWRCRGVTEGFGLPPLEALACGCVVFSSFNHALADYGDPGHVLHQIGCGSLSFDVSRVVSAAAKPKDWQPSPDVLAALLQTCSEEALLHRWQNVIRQLDALQLHFVSERPLKSKSILILRCSHWFAYARRVVNRLPGWPSR